MNGFGLLKKLNPLVCLLVYVFLHLLVTAAALVIDPGTGGEGFERLAISLSYLYFGAALVILVSVAIFWKWSLRNWWITLVLLIIAAKPFIDMVMHPDAVLPWEF